MVIKKIPLRNRILFKLLLPVLVVGIACGTLLVTYTSAPLKKYLTQQFDANLRLASMLGLQICQDSFDYLLGLRLEMSTEMNEVMQTEAAENIKAISKQFPHIDLLILKSGQFLAASSLEKLPPKWEGPLIDGRDDAVLVFKFDGKEVRGHVQFFPFWDWHIISFVTEEDYQSPIRMAYTVTYLSSIGVFLAVVATLLVVSLLSIKKPLDRLVTATDGVTEGQLTKIEGITRNEFGKLMISFNSMIDSLENEKAEVRNLINQLKESEALFRSQFEFGNIGIAITAGGTELIRANDRLCQMLGYSEAELRKLSWTDMTHPDDLVIEMDHFNRMLADEIESYELDKRVLHKSGDLVYFHSNVSCFRNPDRSVRFVIVSLLDITERKQAEEALHKYAHIVSATSDLMSFVDRNYIYQAVNQSYLKYHDKTYEEIIGHSVADLHGADFFNQEIKKEVDKSLSGQKMNYQIWVDYPGRGRRFMDVIYNPYEDELGNISGVVVNARDLTEQKKVQEALQETEEKFRLTFDKSPLGAAMVSPDLRFLHVNDELCRIMGYSKQELLSSGISMLVHPDDVAADMEGGRRIISGEKDRFEHEERSIRKDGQIIWTRTSVGVVRDAAERPLYFLTLIQDITERKRVEEQLAQHRDHLEELVKDRTSQLEQEIFERKRAERQIAASLAEKEVLLREVHHRVKNNLNTVSNLLYLQSRTLEDDRIIAAFRESRNRIQTMARVHELLHSSESLAQINMNDYLKELVTDLMEAYPPGSTVIDTDAKGITLEIDQAIPCGLIVTELFSNALKYAFTTPDPDNRIRIELTVQGDFYRLEVVDNGIGLPPGMEITQTPSLGLRLVEMLIRQLHGKYELKSAPGQGTRFWIAFKATEANLEA